MIIRRFRWLGAALLPGMALLYALYLRDRRETLQKLRAGSRMAETPHGPLEYAVAGSGPAILVLHGASGGYEQGLLLAKFIDPRKYRLVGVSRPGYRKTPFSTGRTPQEQADAACELLDHLGIASAAVLGFSAGALPAVQLALRHPERCLALILVSADLPPTHTDRVSPYTLRRLRFLVNIPEFLLWLLFAPFRFMRVLVDSSRAGHPVLITDPEAVSLGQEMLFSFWPQVDGRDGIRNDIQQIQALDRYPLESIQAPALIIHGAQDSVVPIGLAEHAARTIPEAQSLFIPGGSHLALATHARPVGRRIEQFLDEMER